MFTVEGGDAGVAGTVFDDAAHQRAGVDGCSSAKAVRPGARRDDRRALKTLRGADVISRSGGTVYAARHVESTSRG